MGIPDQFTDIREGFPAWYHPLQRDSYIRDVAEKLNVPVHELGWFVLRKELEGVLADSAQIDPIQLQGDNNG